MLQRLFSSELRLCFESLVLFELVIIIAFVFQDLSSTTALPGICPSKACQITFRCITSFENLLLSILGWNNSLHISHKAIQGSLKFRYLSLMLIPLFIHLCIVDLDSAFKHVQSLADIFNTGRHIQNGNLDISKEVFD